RYLSAALATAVTVVFGYLAVRNVDVDELGESLRESNYWYLLPAFALLVLAFFLRVLRWRCLFAPRTRPGWVPATEALLLGQFLNSVLPFRAGDAARIVALRSFGGPSRVETAGTVVVERIFDVLALLVLLFVLLPVVPEVAWLRAAGVLVIVLTIALAAAVVILRVYGERAVAFFLRPLARLPFLSEARVEAAIRNLTQGVIALRSGRIGLIAFFWTLVSWLVVGASFWFLMLGFDFGLSPVAGLLVVIATGLSHLLPSGPAAVGVFEAAAVVALGAYGIPQTQALSYALVVHALNVVPFLLAGLLIVVLRRDVLSASLRRKRSGQGPVAGAGSLDRPVVAAGVDRGGAGDDEDDVAEPADGHLHVDEVREAR
ncbi:MAG: lysylphosphatidylglycerol synthase transmembrane domain-containing protein, partial [Gaiellaceae bacterium]